MPNTTEQRERLARLRAEIDRRGLAAYVVPKSDEYMLEYAPACSERLAWLSGFTGSAGLALVGSQRAALFVDGRYTTQAQDQTSSELWEHHHVTQSPPAKWVEQALGKGDRLGYDPAIHTPASLEALRTAAAAAGAALEPVEGNLIDPLWSDRPSEPMEPVELYPEELAGESSAAKRARMAAELGKEKFDALVVSAPDSLAWLLNVRGSDVRNVPLVLARAILHADASLELFVRPEKLSEPVRAALSGAVTLAAPEAWTDGLERLRGRRVRLDKNSASEWLVKRLTAAGARAEVGADPCTLAKACKTPAELAGIRAAHVRDGAALTRFFAWFDENTPGDHDEITLEDQLAEFRSSGERYRGPSFDTISAFGASSALPHYRASRERRVRLEAGNVYLVDSGGQYLDGTTDVTRVTVVGTPTAEMKRRYTQVLKGHIALARCRFPSGTTGSQLDPFARQYLWQDGVDFDHGTGHGVGCYLSVHEGPQGISKRPSDVALRPGMVVSNEPGYYKPGAFGIRIENLISVVELSPQPAGAERTTLGFETLTLCPYERRLIELEPLDPEERTWVDAYHALVRDTLAPLLRSDATALRYLERATAPLG